MAADWKRVDGICGAVKANGAIASGCMGGIGSSRYSSYNTRRSSRKERGRKKMYVFRIITNPQAAPAKVKYHKPKTLAARDLAIDFI